MSAVTRTPYDENAAEDRHRRHSHRPLSVPLGSPNSHRIVPRVFPFPSRDVAMTRHRTHIRTKPGISGGKRRIV